jgi:hypothetical protein
LFLGHFAASLAASRAEPRLPLGTSLLAAQLPDAVWPYLLLAGVEQVTIAPGDTPFTPLRFDSYPWSHSLAAMIAWAGVFGVLVRLRGRATRPAVLAGMLVVSHWVLDAASHRPDVPVLPNGPFVGLGLWYSVAGTLIVESLMFVAAVFFYAHGRRLTRGFWILVGVLVILYGAAAFGPPPPNVMAIAISGIVLAPLLWWAGNRVGARTAESASA